MTTWPGFSADPSLRGARGQYRGVARTARAGMVVPQLMRSIGFCMADCDASETNPVSNAACKLGCMDGAGGLSAPVCEPSCGPCVDGTRLCLMTDCDTIERRCLGRPRATRGVLL